MSRSIQLQRLRRLAVPVVLAELGWMTMGVVDTVMVGPLGPEAIGAVGIGGNLFLAVGVFGMGLVLGLDPLVAHAFGARDLGECHRWLWHGLTLATLVAVPISLLVWQGDLALHALEIHPDVLPLASGYLGTVSWSLLPLLYYATLRRYLQGMGVVRPVMVALVTANLINVAANWVLIYGHFGMPALGTVGAAWATVTSRIYMVLVLALAVYSHDARKRSGLWTTTARLEWRRLARLVALGLPAALQMTLEFGVFAAATALAGRLAPASLAAHHIALNLWGLTFMVPLGIASAAAIMVGHAVGRRDRLDARTSGWTALWAGGAAMTVAAVVFLSIPGRLMRLFSADPAVLAMGARLLVICSFFQLFDGLQVVATGALRGLGETRSPMLWNLAGHWGVGLPTGYILCFIAGWDVLGLWIGLSIGLLIVGVVLVGVWHRHSGVT